MTGYRGTKEYIELDLIKVDDNGKVTYWAVVPNTADNMLSIDYSRMDTKELQSIKTDYLGTVKVQQLE